MTAVFTAHLWRRAGQYRVIAAWVAVIGIYLLCLGWVYGLPGAASHTAFSNVAFSWSYADYWKTLGVQIRNMEYDRFGPVSGEVLNFVPQFGRYVLFLPAVLCLIFRKYKALAVIAILIHLSFAASWGVGVRIGYDRAPVGALSPTALQVATKDAFGPTPVVDARHPAKDIRLCLGGFADTSRIVENKIEHVGCDPRWSQNTLHYVFMQRAYLLGDVHEAKRHMDAIDPRHMADATDSLRWRTAIMREWLAANGQPPGNGTYDPGAVSPAVMRGLARLALVFGFLLIAVCVGLAILSGILVRRARCIAVLDFEMKPAKA
ncbi:hypothetical protein [Asticcacaulis sp. 201]|uniref:hypothetical protein n=1 Tax=Asticcacaulis sp. 201 TaxID=3028787 RepID=UPI002916A9D0|nr:hypothetical protein [Asticcacaulis sp. 201]MDV6330136.1 hypothetical protein [Asticcacaulis sp. 201]